MRFTFGTFKYATRDPSFRFATAGPTQIYANTTQSLRKAVRIFHGRGRIAARRALQTSLSGPYWQVGIGAGKKRVAFDLLDEYIQMATADGRPTAGFNVKSDVVVGSDVIAVALDACLFGTSQGYVARLILWDTRGCTHHDARVLCAPTIIAIDQEYGRGTAEGAQLLDVRTRGVFDFSRRSALGAITEVAAVLAGAQS